MKPLRIVLADDEKMARKRLARLLESLGGCEIVAQCTDGEEVLRFLDPSVVDVALLDIDMPGMNGLKTAELATQRGVPVVFITAHEQHAIDAFARGAVHYLLKPVDALRLEEALARVRSTRESKQASSSARIALPVGSDVVFVDIHAISHALYDGHLVTVVADGKSLVTDSSLTELEARLAAGDFVRVHRRALLNHALVQRLNALPSGGYTAIMNDGSEVPVSRQAARALRKQLGL